MASLVTNDFVMTQISYAAVLPMLLVFGGAMLGVLIEAFAPKHFRYEAQIVLTILTLVASLVAVATVARHHQGSTAAGAVIIDGPALIFQGVLLALAVIGVLAMGERFTGNEADAFTPSGSSIPGSPQEAAAVRSGATSTEVFPLMLFSITGMMLFPAAGDLLVMFVALEVLSLPLYILTGLARRRRLLSQEASLKYFLLGAFSSAFFLFGAAMLYGYAGSLSLKDIAAATVSSSGLDGLLIPGLLLVVVGLLFKVGAAPFHAWTPDVYQGAPSAVTGFMAACTKVAAFGALLRLLYVGVEAVRWSWMPILWGVAIATMLVGAVMSVTQTDMKRLLAYSSIAHAGFILVGVLALNRAGISSTLFYLVAYGFMTIAAFALIPLVRSAGNEATHLSQWAGLGRRSPIVAAVMAFLLLGFTGIPLTSGFTAKFAVFSAAIAGGGLWLVIVGIICSGITAYVYIRIIVLMYFSEPTGDVMVMTPTSMTVLSVSIGTLVTLVLGVLPAPLLELASQSTLFLR